MRLSKGAWALVVALAANVVLAVLLSPLGFESRPQSALTPVGLVSIGAVAIGVLLDLASLAVIFRRVRLASILALAGSVAFLIPDVTDRLGLFFRIPAPPLIRSLEFVFIAVLIVTLPLAAAVYKGSRA